MKQLATVKTDGTVQFEVPGDIKTQNLDFGTGVVYNGSSDKETTEATAVQDIPPLQIVMLIVGTRGDVQPFVAIGKRLQVMAFSGFYNFLSNMVLDPAMCVCLSGSLFCICCNFIYSTTPSSWDRLAGHISEEMFLEL